MYEKIKFCGLTESGVFLKNSQFFSKINHKMLYTRQQNQYIIN
jgi:hypothetical protein